MELSVSKSNQLEDLVEQMTEALSLAKNEIKELKSHQREKENQSQIEKLTQELENLKLKERGRQKELDRKKKEYKELEEQITSKEEEYSKIKRENYDLKLALEDKKEIVKKI